MASSLNIVDIFNGSQSGTVFKFFWQGTKLPLSNALHTAAAPAVQAAVKN